MRLVLMVVLVISAAIPALAVQEEGVPVRPGANVDVVMGEPNVLVDTCGDGGPHSGPTDSDVQVTPKSAASLLTPKPSSEAIRDGAGTATIRVAQDLSPGDIFIVSWTAVADGCYSANGSITYVVSLTAPTDGSPGTAPPSRTTGSNPAVLLGTVAVGGAAAVGLTLFVLSRRGAAAGAAGILGLRRRSRRRGDGHDRCVQHWTAASEAVSGRRDGVSEELNQMRADLAREWEGLFASLQRTRDAFDGLPEEMDVVRRILDGVAQVAEGSDP